MADSSRALILRFATDVGPAKAAVEQLTKSVVTNMVSIGAAGGLAAAGMSKFGGSTSTSALGTALNLLAAYKIAVIAASGVTALFGAAVAEGRKELAAMNDIAAKSAASGLSASVFQAVIQEAKDAKLSIKDAEAALLKFKDEARPRLQGESSSTKLLSDIADTGFLKAHPDQFSGFDAYFKTDNVEARLKALILLLHQLRDAGQELAATDIARSFFGGDKGEKMLAALESGKSDIDAMADAGIAAGTIFSNELIAKAKELDDRLADAEKTISNNLTPAVGLLATPTLAIKTLWVEIVEGIAAATTKVGEFLAKLGEVASNPALRLAFPGLAGVIDSLPTVSAALKYGLSQSGLDQDVRNQVNVVAAGTSGRLPTTFRSAADQAERAADQRRIDEEAPLPPKRDLSIDLRKFDEPKAGHAKKASADTDTETALDRQLTSLQKAADIAKAELDTFGLGNQAKERALDLTKARAAAEEDVKKGLRDSADLTAEELTKITAIADATVKWKDNLKKLEEAQASYNSAVSYAGHELLSVLDQLSQKGAKFSDVMKSVAQSLLKSVEQGALLGEGPLAGLFGAKGKDGAVGGLVGLLAGAFKGGVPGLGTGGALADTGSGIAGFVNKLSFGGPRAAGGPVMPGTAYLVGERNPEMFVPSSAGIILPKVPDLSSITPSGPSSITHNVAISVDVSGANGDAAIRQIAGEAAGQAAHAAYRQAIADTPGALASTNLRMMRG